MLMWPAEFSDSAVLLIPRMPTIVLLPDVGERGPETHFTGSVAPTLALSRMAGADSELLCILSN